MAASDKRLGRGLDALFRHSNEAPKTDDVTKLALRLMFPNPDQPRKDFSEESLAELAASIKEHGVLQPILVRPMPQEKLSAIMLGRYQGQTIYQIIAGERRWKASQLAGLVEVPVVVRHFTDQETLAVALIENLQREDLNPMEEARALHQLRETFKLSQDELARQVGKSRSAIANILRLLQLPEIIHNDLACGKLSAGHARALLAISDAAVQSELHQRMLAQFFTVRDAEEAVSYWKEKGALPPLPTTVRPVTQADETLPTVNGQGTSQDKASPQQTADAAQVISASVPQAPLTRSPRRKTPELKRLQKCLTEHLSIKASISGSETKGKITLNYANAEELQRLISALGLSK